jgi:hypothetical protein
MRGNLTLLFLSASLRHTTLSPFFTSIHASTTSRLTFNRVSLSHYFSHFLFAPAHFSGLSVSSSSFSHFLSSVISITAIDVYGMTGSFTPRTPTESFNCTDTVFANNINTFNGGAIFISSDSPIDGILLHTRFSFNSAAIGGAIYFGVINGLLHIISSEFRNNAATAGSHLFVHSKSLISANSQFLWAGGLRSSIELTGNTSLSFSYCQFFQDQRPIYLQPLTNSAFTDCCFMRYLNQPNFPEVGFPFDGPGPLSLTRVAINQKILSESFNNSEECQIAFESVEKTDGGNECRLEPTPSATYDGELGSEGALFVVVSVAFFFVVSILGVMIAMCCQRPDDRLESGDSASGIILDDDLEPVPS